MDPADHPDPEALLAQEPGLPSELFVAELEHSVQRCRVAVEQARRNLQSARAVLLDAEKAVEQAVMAEAFLRSVAPHDASDAP